MRITPEVLDVLDVLRVRASRLSIQGSYVVVFSTYGQLAPVRFFSPDREDHRWILLVGVRILLLKSLPDLIVSIRLSLSLSGDRGAS